MPSSAPTRSPTLAVKSVTEVLAIADELERAAAAQYARFGQMMRQVGHDDVAAVFEALAAEEQQHVESVARLTRSSGASGVAATKHPTLPAKLSAEEIGSPTLLTPYKALSVAVLAEEKAFTFWTYVASTAANEAVRLQAEVMARQELVHAAKLRHARRKAYHADPARRGRRAATAEAETDMPAMRMAAERLARSAIEFLTAASVHLETMSDKESAGLLRQAAEDLHGGLVPEAIAGPAGDDRLLTLRRIELSAAAGRAGILFDAAGRLEQLLERYLDMLEHSADSDVTGELQDFGDRIARNVARVNARLYAVEPNLAGIANGSEAQLASASA